MIDIGLATGGKIEPGPTMATIHIPGQKRVTAGIQRDMAFLLGTIGPGSADVLSGFKQLR